jgi:PAS domain S-box-containing protein
LFFILIKVNYHYINFHGKKKNTMSKSKINSIRPDSNTENDELIKVQNELKRTYENFLDLFDNAPIGYIILDKCGSIKSANKFTYQIFKLNKFDLLGKSFSIFISNEYFSTYFDSIKKSGAPDSIQNCEVCLHNHLSEHIFVNLTISSLLDEDLSIKESKIAIIDITLQKEAEEKALGIQRNFEEELSKRTKEIEDNNRILTEAKDKAEEMNRVKSLFLANISHELRTPMVGILGFSEVIKAETKDPDIKEMASLIHNGGTRLLETLNLILDFSKVESEKLNLNYENTDLNEIVKDVVNVFSETVQKKNLLIEYITENKEINANIDPRIFRQIINNLVNNAIKYTNEGTVEVSLIANNEKLILKVKDTGVGIEKGKINLIFDEYHQLGDNYNRQFNGIGLGLALTKRFIELMNGTISIKSEIYKGTEFTVVLPLAPKEKTEFKIGDSFKGMKALIVEDDEISYSLLKNIISDLCEADIATNMEDALNKASEHLYDFVIMDINLGGEDTGIDVTRELRTIKNYHKVPIIAVTAYAMKGDKNFFINSGLDAYVSKPFTRSELIETIKRSIESSDK